MRARDLPTWRQAWAAALYGPDGFFRRERPADHFRTSVHASTLFAQAVLGLVRRHHLATVVDIGAGRGELLRQLHQLAEPHELRLVGVDLAAPPPGLPGSVQWRDDLSGEFEGLLVANEWLDNLPCDVLEVDERGVPRYVHVDPATGTEALGEECREPWVQRWWPAREPGARVEVGAPRDRAWADVVRRLRHGVALAIDYGHTWDSRPWAGSLAAYRHGRQVPTVPDGSRDITAHVAVDSLMGDRMHQREALRALGVGGTRPPREQAHTDPAGYVAALGRASEAAELTSPGGLGDFWWVAVTRGVTLHL